MTSFFDLASTRRSYRKFTEEPVDDATIDKLLTTALMAPAGKRANPWEFIVVTDADMRQKLAACKPAGSAFVATAPVSVVVIADTEKSDVWTEDCSIAAIYLQLAAEDLNLGSCWAQVRLRQSCEEGKMASQYVKELLQIPDKYEVECIISIGHKTEQRGAFDMTRLQTEKIHRGQF
ncbi:MAG: nitroreductase family protein [Paludibacteraceae bacterium]|nr:nitroreductase family protein [Paludibacteraceae bacterium]